MKKIVVAIMVLTMMVSAIAAMAQTEKNFSITPRLAVDFYLNKDTKDALKTSFGILADIDVASLPVGFEIGFLKGHKTQDGYEYDYDEEEIVPVDLKSTVRQIPVLVTYKYPFSENFYAKIGAGVNFVHAKADLSANYEYVEIDESVSKSKTQFSWLLGVGYNFSNNFSAELAYRDSGKFKFDDDLDLDLKSGAVELNVGYTF